MDIKIHKFITKTKVEGPGTRFCMWVQGCSIQCKGCANTDLWDFNQGISYSVNEIVRLIKKQIPKIEGITILGGEPLDQIKPVTEICKKSQELGLSVMLFTGYEYDKLIKETEFQKLVKYIDILIDGKYEQDKQDFSRPWVGSSNQNYYFLTNKYNKEILKTYKNKFEIRIDKNNVISANGMGNTDKLKNIIL